MGNKIKKSLVQDVLTKFELLCIKEKVLSGTSTCTSEELHNLSSEDLKSLKKTLLLRVDNRLTI